MSANDFETKHILTKLKCADSTLQMIRDIYPEAASLLMMVDADHRDIREILSWREILSGRADDAESPAPGYDAEIEAPTPGRGTGGTA